MASGSVRVKFHGVAAFEVTTEKDQKILIDPFIEHNQLARAKLTDFPRVDLLLVSHGAEDHMGDTLALMRQTKAHLLSGLDVATHIRRNGIPRERTQHVLWGDLIDFDGIKVKILESKHGSFIDSAGTFLSTIPLGFLVTTHSGIRIYHPGDTAIFGDLKLFGQLYKPHIGLMPVGNVPGAYAHMDPREAALATKWLGLRYAIPMHYWKGSKEPEQFRDEVKKVSPRTKVVLLQPGEEIIAENGKGLKVNRVVG
jgi:L-ascorbate metabolism protein UlaG (beta-lactamase superfamily)